MASAAAGCAGRVGASYYGRRRAAGDGLSLVAPMVTVLPKIFELCMNRQKRILPFASRCARPMRCKKSRSRTVHGFHWVNRVLIQRDCFGVIGTLNFLCRALNAKNHACDVAANVNMRKATRVRDIEIARMWEPNFPLNEGTIYAQINYPRGNLELQYAKKEHCFAA